MLWNNSYHEIWAFEGLEYGLALEEKERRRAQNKSMDAYIGWLWQGFSNGLWWTYLGFLIGFDPISSEGFHLQLACMQGFKRIKPNLTYSNLNLNLNKIWTELIWFVSERTNFESNKLRANFLNRSQSNYELQIFLEALVIPIVYALVFFLQNKIDTVSFYLSRIHSNGLWASSSLPFTLLDWLKSWHGPSQVELIPLLICYAAETFFYYKLPLF